MEDLELGLSLCAKKAAAHHGDDGFCSAGNEGSRSWSWGKHCRILTAKDFPIAKPASETLSSSSSVSSSSDSAGGVDARTKRDADLMQPFIASEVNPTSLGLIGWPPVRAFRINNMVNQNRDSNAPEAADAGDSSLKPKAVWKPEEPQDRQLNAIDGSRFIKARMDGDPIGRKVDLDAHESYETLALALEAMFFKRGPSHGSDDFALTYEDRDGDWMLLGDVPWSMFLGTVKRLRVMKVSESGGQKPRLSFSHNQSGLLPT